MIKIARDKLDRYTPLIRLRDELRGVIEMCSLSAINENMEKRNMYAAVIGQSYCAEEADAARNIIRMLSLESEMMKGKTDEIDMTNEDEPHDTRLPRHIFDELLELHNRDGINDPAVTDKLKAIPGINTYRRCFKWVINYATKKVYTPVRAPM